MNVETLLYWRAQDITEIEPAPSFRRGDTAPEIAVDFTAGGTALSLLGSKVTGRVRFSLALIDPLSRLTTRLRVKADPRVVVGSVLLVETEKLLVRGIDDVTEAGRFAIAITRGHLGTTAAPHSAGTLAEVVVVERTCPLVSVPENNRCYLPWVEGDNAKAGVYELEFEVTDSIGKRFTAPTSPLRFTVTDKVG